MAFLTGTLDPATAQAAGPLRAELAPLRPGSCLHRVLGGQVHAGTALPGGAPEPQMVLEARQGSHCCVARSEARVDGGGEGGRTPRDCQPDPPPPRPPPPVLQEAQHRRWWPREQHAARPGDPGLSLLGAEHSCSPCAPILAPRGPTPATRPWLR